MKNKQLLFLSLLVFTPLGIIAQEPVLEDIPDIPAKQPVNSVEMLDWESYPEYQLDVPIAKGPYQANWASIEAHYPGEPKWLRDAKFGIWVHFGPQASGESGDWYARKMYNPKEPAYANHNKRFGHPSEVGYKEVLRDWNPAELNPAELTKLYKDAGARFLMIQAVHHDNYDLWNSKYHKWNSVNIGPKRDILGEWTKACKKEKMHYGFTFHHEYTWWWWQTAFCADTEGPKAGVPYDGNLTKEYGKGKWWEGYDPRELYGIDLREYKTVDDAAHSPWSPPKAGIFQNHIPYCQWYAKQWALRMMDVTAHYDPDFIYTDGTVQGPFTGDGTGTGFKANAMQTVIADYYNRVLKSRGKVDAFSIVKFRKNTNGTVNTCESYIHDDIKADQPWIAESPVGDWFYAPGFTYRPNMMIRFIIEAAARDGNAALNICLRPDGSIDKEAKDMLLSVGQWMKLNGQAIYGSHAWTIPGEGQRNKDGKLRKMPGGGLNRWHADFQYATEDYRFTVGQKGELYAFCMTVPKPGEKLLIKSFGTNSPDMKKTAKKVTMLGYKGKLQWTQSADGLHIIYPTDAPKMETSVVFCVK